MEKEISKDTHVYCTECKHLTYVSDIEEPDENSEKYDEWIDSLVPSCEFSEKCNLDDSEDSRPFAERPFYEEMPPQPELGNMLFGNYRGGYPVEPRTDMEFEFGKLLSMLECDGYGIPKYSEKEKKYIYPPNTHEITTGFGNETFEIHPYYWGNDEKLFDIPNFIYYPLNLELRWYKYPLRDSWSNIELTPEVMKNICEKCIESIKE